MASWADLYRKRVQAGANVVLTDAGSRIGATGSNTTGTNYYQDDALARNYPGLFTYDKETMSVRGTQPDQYTLGMGNPNNRVTGRYQVPGSSKLSNGGVSLRLLQGLSVRQAISFLHGLKDEQVKQIQNELWWSGMYKSGSRVTWGIIDDDTKEAFQNFVGEMMDRPELTAGELLDQATRGYRSRLLSEMDDEEAKKRAGGGGGVDLPEDILLQPEVTSAARLDELIDTIGQELFGRNISPERKQSLIAELQQREMDRFYETEYKQRKMQLDQRMSQLRAENGTEEIDNFLQAIMAQESGGDPNAVNVDSGAFGLFQIMPENWVPWAREAGVDPSDRSAENQMRVARHKMAEYYKSFGNWRDVAISWYAGPGAVGASWLDRPQDGYPSVNEYVDSIIDKMRSNGTQAPIMKDPTLSVEFKENLDLSAEARRALRAANPAEYEAVGLSRQAQNFFGLLAKTWG